MFYLLLSALAIYILVIVIPYFATAKNLLNVLVQPHRYVPRSRDHIPAPFKAVFTQSVGELKPLGFQPITYLQVQNMYAPGEEEWAALFYNKTYNTYAIVEIRFPLDPTNAFRPTFFTCLQNETVLMTVNGEVHSIVGTMPNTIVTDAYAYGFLEQWQHHQKALEQHLELSKSAASDLTPPHFTPLKPQQFLHTINAHFKAYLDYLVETKEIKPVPAGKHYYFSFTTALKLTWTLLQKQNVLKSMLKVRQQNVQHNPEKRVEIPVELQVKGFWRMRRNEQRQGKRRRYLGPGPILAVTLVLFVGAALLVPWLSFLGIGYIAALIGVIFFHELGHFLAMRQFNYNNTSIFFIPLFGGGAVGDKDQVSLREEVIVLLAGPVPGLILGLIFAILANFIDAFRGLEFLAWMLILINLLNLLPIYPLDGGKIANVLIFAPIPYADLAFKGLAGLLLFFSGWGIGKFLGLAIVLSIPLDLRSNTVTRKLRPQLATLAADDRDSLLKAIFQTIQQSGYGNLTFNYQYLLAKDALQRCHQQRANWLTRGALLVAYTVSLVGGLIGSLLALLPLQMLMANSWMQSDRGRPDRTEQAITETVPDYGLAAIERATTAIKANPQNVQGYLRRAAAHRQMYSLLSTKDVASSPDIGEDIDTHLDNALQDYAHALALDPENVSIYEHRILLYRITQETEAALVDYNQIIQLMPEDSYGYERRAKFYVALEDWEAALKDYDQAIRFTAQNPQIYLDRAALYGHLTDYERAIADVTLAIELDPNQPWAYELRSEFRSQLEDQAGAEADAEKAQQLYGQGVF